MRGELRVYSIKTTLLINDFLSLYVSPSLFRERVPVFPGDPLLLWVQPTPRSSRCLITKINKL